jgi:hypothetical protein
VGPTWLSDARRRRIRSGGGQWLIGVFTREGLDRGLMFFQPDHGVIGPSCREILLDSPVGRMACMMGGVMYNVVDPFLSRCHTHHRWEQR